jgi:hypothetical protein
LKYESITTALVHPGKSFLMASGTKHVGVWNFLTHLCRLGSSNRDWGRHRGVDEQKCTRLCQSLSPWLGSWVCEVVRDFDYWADKLFLELWWN